MPPKLKEPVNVTGNTTGSKQQFNETRNSADMSQESVKHKPPITIADDPDVSDLEIKLL